MTRAITRVIIDKDSGHAPAYGQAVAWSVDQLAQQTNLSGTPSEKAKGPYAGSGDVKVGPTGVGVHRQFDQRMPHLPIPPNIVVESPAILLGGAFPWLKSGSSTVYVNKQQCGRAGDWTICGAVIKTGELTVLAGD